MSLQLVTSQLTSPQVITRKEKIHSVCVHPMLIRGKTHRFILEGEKEIVSIIVRTGLLFLPVHVDAKARISSFSISSPPQITFVCELVPKRVLEGILRMGSEYEIVWGVV